MSIQRKMGISDNDLIQTSTSWSYSVKIGKLDEVENPASYVSTFDIFFGFKAMILMQATV